MARRGRSRRSGGFGGLGRSGGMLPPVLKNGLAGWGAASAGEMLGFGGLLPAVGFGFLAAGVQGSMGAGAKVLLKGVDIKGIGGQIGANMIG